MTDIKIVVDAIVGLQEENERLKRVNKVLQERVNFLENNKPCKDCASNPISEYTILENESQFWKEKIDKLKQERESFVYPTGEDVEYTDFVKALNRTLQLIDNLIAECEQR